MNIDLLYLGAFLVVAVISALWKMSSLQGDLNDRWRQRVQVAEAGLSEKAAEELRKIQIQINEVLVSEGSFDPNQVVTDPGKLLEGVQRFKHFIETRDRLQNRFQQLLLLGPIFFNTLLILLVGLLLAFAYFVGFLPIPFLGLLGIGCCVVSIALIASSFGVYVFLLRSLSGAEILSTSEN